MGKRVGNATVPGNNGAYQTFKQYDDACLDKVEIGEPIFVLRAQDELAPSIVHEWCAAVYRAYTSRGLDVPPELEEKLEDARNTADTMYKWPQRKLPGQKFPVESVR